jgi:Cu-Zn family superoxide dismutase
MNILKCAGNMSVAGLLATALAHPAAAESANAVLKDANGRDVRTVSLSQTPAGVLLKLSLKGMTPGRACLSHFVPWASASRPPSNRRVRTSTLAIRATASWQARAMPATYRTSTFPPAGSLEAELVNAAITIDLGKPNSVFHPGGAAVVITRARTITRPILPETPATGPPAA